MDANQVGRLRDVLTSAQLIAAYVKNTSEEQFKADPQKQDAVIRRIEIIGEATVHLTDATRLAIPELPFRKMRGMRNIVAHDSANVDLDIVWQRGHRLRAGSVRVLRGLLRKTTFVGKRQRLGFSIAANAKPTRSFDV
jgi:uncharacterized protein with HEPN domain